MTRINNNNLENLKALYGAYETKKTNKEEKKEPAKAVQEFEGKKVEASALDAVAAQIWGAQLAKVDITDGAVEKRIEEAFANSPFMATLNELQGIEEEVDFVSFAMANITGVNHSKLAKYLAKPLSEETASGVVQYFDKLTA